MKRTLLFLFIVIVVVINCKEDRIDALNKEWADILQKTKQKVPLCKNKFNVSEDETRYVDYVIKNYSPTLDLDNRTLNVGCFFACISEEEESTPVNMDMDVFIRNLKTIFSYSSRRNYFDLLPIRVADICANQVKGEVAVTGETDLCRMSFKFFLCYSIDLKKALNREKENIDEWANDVSNILLTTKNQVLECVNATNTTFNDIEYAREALNNDTQIEDFDKKIRKIVYLFQCFDKKKELIPDSEAISVNRNNTKEMLKEILLFNKVHVSKILSLYYQETDHCANRVRNKTDNCDPSVKSVLCHPFCDPTQTSSFCLNDPKVCCQSISNTDGRSQAICKVISNSGEDYTPINGNQNISVFQARWVPSAEGYDINVHNGGRTWTPILNIEGGYTVEESLSTAFLGGFALNNFKTDEDLQ